MAIREIFKMPKAVGISGRTSTITNSFVSGIIPAIEPSNEELEEALKILGLDGDNLKCAYCDDRSTEWDHLRPIVARKRPTGYISEIHNLVPSCGKCNQSKGGKYWKDWIMSDAKLSPKKRGTLNLDEKIKRLEAYEKWGNIKPLDFESIMEPQLWDQHWKNCQNLHDHMKEAQKLAEKIRITIRENIYNKNPEHV